MLTEHICRKQADKTVTGDMAYENTSKPKALDTKVEMQKRQKRKRQKIVKLCSSTKIYEVFDASRHTHTQNTHKLVLQSIHPRCFVYPYVCTRRYAAICA